MQMLGVTSEYNKCRLSWEHFLAYRMYCSGNNSPCLLLDRYHNRNNGTDPLMSKKKEN